MSEEIPHSNIYSGNLIFAGGTGRSGTTIIGKLLSRHSQVQLSRPTEIKFLTSGNGLLDVYQNPRFTRTGKVLFGKKRNFQRFKSSVWKKWWEKEGKRGGFVGIKYGIAQDKLEELILQLEMELEIDRATACTEFLLNFVRNQVLDDRIRYWIDTTPPNLIRANEIAYLFPESKFIHMIRDGRDVASSVVKESWGPIEHMAALEWWRTRVLQIISSTSALSNQVQNVWLEDLVEDNRQSEYQNILHFLELKNEKRIESYFKFELTAKGLNRGRWRSEVKDTVAFNERYQEIFLELLEKGLPKPKRQI